MRPDVERLRNRLLELEPDADSGRLRMIRAPGRVNLIGEHTDYNDGLVLPVAIDLEIVLVTVPTDDRRVRVTIDGSGEVGELDLDLIGPARGTWIDYAAGVARELIEAGIEVRGFRGVMGSTIPVAAGLSSSAALELAAALALGTSVPPADAMTLARLAQRAENRYVGVQCGLMDQVAVALGRPDAALLLDCRTLDVRPVGLPLRGHALVAIETGSPRRLGASDYNVRRAQCESVVAALAVLDPSVRALRDVTLPMLDYAADRLDPVAMRRAEHVIRENGRVTAAATAFEAGDLGALGDLFAASHASLRDLFEVSSPALDALVEIASGVPGVVATRMTGAGFGGCTVAIVERDALDDLRRAVARDYQARTGLKAIIHVVEPAAGADVIWP